VIIPQEAVRDPEEMLQVLAREHVTRIVLFLLCAHLSRLRSESSVWVPDLKLWSCSGEFCRPISRNAFVRRFPEATLLNIYGSSEVAADVTCHEVSNGDLLLGDDWQADQQHPDLLVDEYEILFH